MGRRCVLVMSAVLIVGASGCQLNEIRSKTKFGPSFRHKGSNRTNSVRWTVQQGYDFKWDQGVTTGIGYKRRDTDNGSGDNDNAVYFDISFPIWKAKKQPSRLKRRVKKLEKRLEVLEAQLGLLGEQ